MRKSNISIANFLLFISAYMLFPVLPVEMADRLDMPLTKGGYIFLFMILGRVSSGPFINYLVDAFRRKYLTATAFIAFLAASAGYIVVDEESILYILSFIQGVAFGVASSSLITLCIDLSSSENRNRANIIFGWFTRAGMILGIALGSILYLNINFMSVLTVSLLTGTIGIFFLFFTHVPFRAPIGNKILSTDRFLLPQGWVPAINLILVALVSGLLIPLVHFEVSNMLIGDSLTVPYSVVVCIGFFCSIMGSRMYFRKHNYKEQILVGLTVLLLSVSLFILWKELPGQIISAILLGGSLALITPVLLMMFIDLSSHCQRASANTTNLLAWGTGISLGIALSCHLKDDYSSLIAYQAAMFLAALALIFFILVSYPYYRKKRRR